MLKLFERFYIYATTRPTHEKYKSVHELGHLHYVLFSDLGLRPRLLQELCPSTSLSTPVPRPNFWLPRYWMSKTPVLM